MEKPQIHFVHANGFPAGTYRKLFSFLRDQFEIGYLDRHGHNPDYPITPGWKHLKEELRSEIERRYRKPVIGLGHSLGGILHLLTAADHPELYRSVVLLDSPVISPLSSLALKVIRKTGLGHRMSPTRETLRRRSVWKNTDEAFGHFAKKSKFRSFDEEVLRDYVEQGTVENETGIRLFFEPEVEAGIYQTLPEFLPRLRGRIKVPVAYIGGTRSREARLARIGFMRKNFPFNYFFVEGTHLFPFENPKKTADLIKRAIRVNLNE